MPPRAVPKRNSQGYYRTTVKMPDGSRREIRARTEREYKDKLLEAEIERKQWTAKAERVLLKDFSLQWLEQIAAPELRPNTIKNHKGRIDKWIIPRLGSKPLASITTEDVDGFLHALRKVEWRPGHHLTNRSIYNIFTTLNLILDQAVTWKRIPANPCDHAQRLKLNTVQQLVLSTEEARILWAALEGNLYERPLRFLLLTGLRRGELAGLLREDYDEPNRLIRVRRNLQHLKGQGLVLAEPKTAKSNRTIPLSPIAVQILNEEKNAQGKQVKTETLDFLFLNPMGRRVNPNQMWVQMKRITKAAGITVGGTHMLRHTALTELFHAGVDSKTVQEIAGHELHSTTVNLYIHSGNKDKSIKAMDALGGVFEGSCGSACGTDGDSGTK